MNAKSGSARPNTSVCQDIGGVRVLSTTDALCCSHACLNNCQLLVSQKCVFFQKFLVSLEFPDTRCCNTSKPSIGPEYTKVLTVSTARHQVNRKQEVSQSVCYWLPRVWFRCWQCKENEAVSHHAWNTCVVFDEQANIPRVLVYYTKTDGILHLLVCEANQLVHLLAQRTAGLSQHPVK